MFVCFFLLLDTYLAGSGLIGISLSILSRALLLPCEIGTVICCNFPPLLFYPQCLCIVNRKAESSLPCPLQPMKSFLWGWRQTANCQARCWLKMQPLSGGSNRVETLNLASFSLQFPHQGISIKCKRFASFFLISPIRFFNYWQKNIFDQSGHLCVHQILCFPVLASNTLVATQFNQEFPDCLSGLSGHPVIWFI